MLPLLVSALALASIGCKNAGNGADGGYAATDLVSISLTYPFGIDAAMGRTRVTIDPLGNATCRGTYRAGVLSQGQLPATDTTIPDLLSRPGLMHDLATWCSVNRSDAGPYLITQFAGEDAAHGRLVEDSCTNNSLNALVQAMVQIGDACVVAATLRFNPPDGGSHGAIYDLIPGPACYKVNAVQGVSDGCGSNLLGMEGQFVPGSYDPLTAIFLLGDGGVLGQGLVGNNYGTLAYESDAGDPTIEGCTWHQRLDTTIILMSAYTLTASMVEQRTSIAPACAASVSSCTSSWTWSMWFDWTKSPADHCQ